eukprot:gene30555-40606_t
MAFTTYCLTLWTALDILNPRNVADKVRASFSEEGLKFARNIRGMAAVNAVLVATTVLSGAYVAGNDAGRAYNTFPMMNDEWIPSEVLDMVPVWRNFFENTATVQLQHRILAMTTLAGVGAMYFRTMASKSAAACWAATPRYTRIAMHAVAAMSVTQVGLGISTLLLYVPIPLAALHQAGSLTLLTLLTCLGHSLRFASPSAVQNIVRVVGNYSTKIARESKK